MLRRRQIFVADGGDGHRCCRRAESVTDHGFVATGAQQNPDCGRVNFGLPDGVVDDRNIELQLPGMFRPELVDLQPDDHVAKLHYMEQQHVDVELVQVDL